jgi:hypothetical protein
LKAALESSSVNHAARAGVAEPAVGAMVLMRWMREME